MSDVLVKKSKIHGRGVFAARDFKKGEMVLRWQPEKVMTKEEKQKAPKNLQHYIVKLEENKYILMGKPERYINHSCDFNTRTEGMSDVAVRDIKAGEEITGNYSKEHNQFENLKCNCGGKNCRGVI